MLYSFCSNTKLSSLLVSSGFIIGVILRIPLAQGEVFQNLNFEQIVQSEYSLTVPHWTWGLSGGTYQTQYFHYNDLALDSPCVSVHDSNSEYLLPFSAEYPYGFSNYSLMLQTGSPFFSPPNQPVYISQVGDVPDYANSIVFSTDWCWGGNLTVLLNGVAIPTSLYAESGPDLNGRTVYSYIGDIRSFTNQQNVELKFDLSQTPGWYTTFGAQQSLDDIWFSDEIVPEPSEVILLATAVSGLIVVCRCRKKK